TTSSSAAVNRGASGGGVPACFSAPFTASRSILVARQSAPDLLISWEAMASRLVIVRRRPFSVTTTGSFSPRSSNAARFFAGRPRGLADGSPCLKRVPRRLAVAHLVIRIGHASFPFDRSLLYKQLFVMSIS